MTRPIIQTIAYVREPRYDAPMFGLRSSLRQILSAFLPVGEDPHTLLEHLFEDLQALVPQIDRQVDWLVQGISLLEKELAQQDAEDADASSERREAISQARKASRAQLEAFGESYQIALALKRDTLQRLQDRCREVARSLPAAEEAQWREEISRVVSESASAHMDPELAARIQEIEARIEEEEASRGAGA